MGKSQNGKEVGAGITQRKDGIYQARFINRFGKRQTIYAKTLNEVRQKLRNEQYEDEKALNVVDKNMTLNEWFEVWMETCKKNCRDTTKGAYITHYKRIKEELGWRKIASLNLIIMQEAVNKLETDNARKNSKKILVDMFNKAVDADLLLKNVAKQINTVISKEEKKERRVLTVRETQIFLEKAEKTFYFNLFVLALETGLRIGELCAPKDYGNLVFVTRNNQPTQQFLIKECINSIVSKIMKQDEEFKPITSHTFRHTFATRAIESGMYPKTLQRLLGHGTLQMTMDLYCHVTEDTLFEEMQKFEQKCS